MALIGITACGKLEDYRQAVIHVGGEVRILERSMTHWRRAERYRRLTADLEVETSSQRGTAKNPIPGLVDIEPLRDEFEIALVREGPVQEPSGFAICRGLQRPERGVQGHSRPGHFPLRFQARWNTDWRSHLMKRLRWPTKCGSTRTPNSLV